MGWHPMVVVLVVLMDPLMGPGIELLLGYNFLCELRGAFWKQHGSWQPPGWETQASSSPGLVRFP